MMGGTTIHPVWTEVNLARGDALESLSEVCERFFGDAHLKEAGCPVRLADIGLDRDSLYRGFIIASIIRKRYTTLDLADEFGLLEKLAESASTNTASFPQRT